MKFFKDIPELLYVVWDVMKGKLEHRLVTYRLRIDIYIIIHQGVSPTLEAYHSAEIEL